MSSRHYQSLDAMRGIAAILVLIGHASAMMCDLTWVPNKSLAVIFFFALSGFVMSASYEVQLRNGMPIREFLFRRICRLYPVIVIASLLSFAAYALFDPKFVVEKQSVIALFGSMAAMPTPKLPMGWTRFAINPPEWSLFCEMICYVVYALLISHIDRRTLIGLTVILISTSGWLVFQYYGDALPVSIIVSCAAYSVGTLTFNFHSSMIFEKHLRSPIAFLVAGSTLVFLTILPVEFGAVAKLVCLVLVSPALLIIGAQQTIKHKAFYWLGAVSYPLYLIHWSVLVFAVNIVRPVWGPGAAVAFSCIVACVAAVATEVYFDKPIRDYFARQRTKVLTQGMLNEVVA